MNFAGFKAFQWHVSCRHHGTTEFLQDRKKEKKSIFIFLSVLNVIH